MQNEHTEAEKLPQPAEDCDLSEEILNRPVVNLRALPQKQIESVTAKLTVLSMMERRGETPMQFG